VGDIDREKVQQIRIFRVDQASPIAGALMRFYSYWKETEDYYRRDYN
jgi:hypothetical protein